MLFTMDLVSAYDSFVFNVRAVLFSNAICGQPIGSIPDGSREFTGSHSLLPTLRGMVEGDDFESRWSRT